MTEAKILSSHLALNLHGWPSFWAQVADVGHV